MARRRTARKAPARKSSIPKTVALVVGGKVHHLRKKTVRAALAKASRPARKR